MKKTTYIVLVTLVLTSITSQLKAQDKTNKPTVTLLAVEIIYPEGTKLNPLLVSPNPAKAEVKISLADNKDMQGYTLELYNNQGTRLLQQKYTGKLLDVSTLQAGIYNVILRKGQKMYSQKLVVGR